GAWALDVDIERSNDYSPYSNDKHHWRLPRRLRITEAFGGGYQYLRNGPICIPRVTGEGFLSIFTAVDGEPPEIQVPSDETVFRVALCRPKNMSPFIVRAEAVALPAIAYEMRPSDKGRYLNAMLSRAGGLNSAIGIFLRKFWKDQ